MTPTDDLTVRRWHILATAMLTFFAIGLTFFAVPPLIPDLRAELALGNLAIGILMGAIAIPAIALSIPMGAALDRWPPRRAGLAGLAVMLAGAVLFAAAPTYGVLLAGRLVFGAGALLLNLLLARLISVAFAGRELALAMGLFTGVYPFSMILLFSLHPRLHALLGWRGEMALLAALVLIAIPVHGLVVPPRWSTANDTSDVPAGNRPSPALAALGIAWMLYFAAFAAVPTFAPDWVGGGARGLLITSVITWVALLATPVAGALIDRTGHAGRWCVVATAGLSATLGLMAAGAVPPVAAMVAIGLVAAVVPPAVYSLPARLVVPARLGFAFGFITALSNLGTLAGPALAGAARDTWPGWAATWGALAVLALAAAVSSALTGALRSGPSA